MRHCCAFKAEEIYYLKETELYTTRKLSIGICPICGKLVAELYLQTFSGRVEKQYGTGAKAGYMLNDYKDSILYSMKQCNYSKFKSKPYGWKYGVNKVVKIKGEERIKQYAYDFYGNKELVKTI